MGHTLDALHVIREAEVALRRLITNALSAQNYRDIGVIASMADKLSAIQREVQSQADALPVRRTTTASYADTSAPAPELPATSDSRTARVSEVRQRAVTRPRPLRPVGRMLRRPQPTADSYPRFQRDGDRLVKIGWSKQDDRSYEHKTPRAAVLLFVQKVRDTVAPGTVFSMERLLPLKDEQGQEVPSYQAYVVLAWLRNCGVIDRRTKEGYTYLAGALDAANVEQLWQNLPEKD